MTTSREIRHPKGLKREIIYVLKRHGTGLHREIIHKILVEVSRAEGVPAPKLSSVAQALGELRSRGLIVRVAPGAYMITGGHR